MIFLWGILVVATVGMLMARVRTVSRQTATFLYTLIMTCAVCALIVLRAPLLDEHMVTQLRLLCANHSSKVIRTDLMQRRWGLLVKKIVIRISQRKVCLLLFLLWMEIR